jgi:hypothetical protein
VLSNQSHRATGSPVSLQYIKLSSQERFGNRNICGIYLVRKKCFAFFSGFTQNSPHNFHYFSLYPRKTPTGINVPALFQQNNAAFRIGKAAL